MIKHNQLLTASTLWIGRYRDSTGYDLTVLDTCNMVTMTGELMYFDLPYDIVACMSSQLELEDREW